jgi:hypothetical protein
MRMMRVHLLLPAISLLITMSAGPSGADHSPQSKPAPASPLTVTLLADSDLKTGVPEGLAGSAWRMETVRNILGGGSDLRLQFKKSADGALQAVFDSAWLKKTGDKPATREHRDEPCDVHGPILRWGDQQQTFVLIPGKTLALNVFVPLGGGKWYFTARQLYNPKAGDGANQIRWRDEEMMISFSDDPLTHGSGSGSIEIRSGTPKVLKQDVQFTLEQANRTGRLVRVSSKQNGAVWARLFFPPHAKYGIRTDEPGITTQLYVPDKA